MDEIITTDYAVHGDSDIQGVKNAAFPDPEEEKNCEPYDADKASKENLSEGDTDEALLEKEFEELIKGRYGKVYKRRTEAIIRRRLRSGRAHPSPVAEIDLSEDPKPLPDPEQLQPLPRTADTAVKESLVEAAKSINRSRPIENGVSGSCGVVSRINVSALNGRDVLSILKRVGAGEKIKFN